MNTLGVFSKACSYHPGKYISEICTASLCEKRAICAECRKSHNSQHLNSLHPLLDFLSIDIEEESFRAVNLEKECEETIEETTRQLDEALGRAKKSFETYLDTIRSDIIEHIRGKEYESIRSSIDLREEILKLRVACFVNVKENMEELNSDRQNFIDLTLELKKNIQDSLKRKETIEKSISIVERDFETLSEKLRQALNYFKTSVIVNQNSPLIAISNNFSPAKYTRPQANFGLVTPSNVKSNSENKKNDDCSSDSKSTITTSPFSVANGNKVSPSTYILPTKFSASSPLNEQRISHKRNSSNSKFSNSVNVSVIIPESASQKYSANRVSPLQLVNYSVKK